MKLYNIKTKLIFTGVNLFMLCTLNVANAEGLKDLPNQYNQLTQNYQCESGDQKKLKLIDVDNDELIVKVVTSDSELKEIKTTYFAKKESEENGFLFSSKIYNLKNENFQNFETAKLKIVQHSDLGRGGCGRGGCLNQLQTVQALLSVNSNETIFDCY